MAGFKTVYVCQQCGVQMPKWAGQCPSCKAWNSLVEEIIEARSTKHKAQMKAKTAGKVVRLSELSQTDGKTDRISTGKSEFDRVLGGGMVPGSVVLVAGEPGIGKSTLLTQLALRQAQDKPLTLYVCGEESPDQVGLRVRRLGEARSTKRKYTFTS